MTTALVVIDVQDSFRLQPSWAEVSLPDIVERTQELVTAAREHGEVVAWVLHHSPGTGSPFDPTTGLCRLQPGLQVAADDVTVTKTSHNAFTTTNLDQQLRQRGITRLRICGIRIEQCVETTARVASDMGYSVELVADACATHPLPLADGTGVLSADQVTQRTLAALTGRFATITTIDEVVRG